MAWLNNHEKNGTIFQPSGRLHREKNGVVSKLFSNRNPQQKRKITVDCFNTTLLKTEPNCSSVGDNFYRTSWFHRSPVSFTRWFPHVSSFPNLRWIQLSPLPMLLSFLISLKFLLVTHSFDIQYVLLDLISSLFFLWF